MSTAVLLNACRAGSAAEVFLDGSQLGKVGNGKSFLVQEVFVEPWEVLEFFVGCSKHLGHLQG